MSSAAAIGQDEATAQAAGDEWRRVTNVMRGAAALAWVGFFSLYVKVWVEPQGALGNLDEWARSVTDGRAAAPFQYRFLVPSVLVWMEDHAGIRIDMAERLVDAVCLALAAVAIDRLLRHLGLIEWIIPATTYAAFLGIGTLWWGKFETMAALAAVAWSCLVIVRAAPRALLLLTVPVLLGCRTDLVAALGVAFLAQWWWGSRKRPDLILGLVLGAVAVVATGLLSKVFDEASYGPTGLVQLAHNVKPAVWLTGLSFLAPALAPYVLLRKNSSAWSELRRGCPAIPALLALISAEVVLTCAVGRIEEVRMFFPLAAPLAVAGIVGWRAVLSIRPSLGAATPVEIQLTSAAS